MRSRAVLPFVVCAVVAIATLGVPPYSDRPVLLGLAVGLTGLIEAAVLFLPWGRWPSWTQDLPALAFFPVVALLREASGAGTSSMSALVVLPILWVALYGRRESLYAAGVLTALVFISPLLIVGAPEYPSSDWRRAVMWLLVAWLVAPAVQEVVHRLQDRESALSLANDELDSSTRQWELFGDLLADTMVLIVDQDLVYRQITGAGAMRAGVVDWEGKSVHETSNGPNTATLVPLYRAALAGEPGSCELRATLTGSSNEVTVVPFRYHGEPAAMVVARDVTLAQRREDDIRALHNRVEQMVDESPTGVALADREGRVSRVNPALRRTLGLSSSASTRGMTLASLQLVPEGADVRELLRQASSGHRTLQLRVDRSTGDPLDLVVELVAVNGLTEADQTLLVNVHDVSEQRRFEEQLKHLAAHDPLTGLANRRAFDEALDRHLKDCARYGARGAVLMLDLDHFKEVNDTHGHEVGDQLLVSVAAVLRRLLRDSDVIARLGGDEFVVLLPHATRSDVEVVAARVVEGIRREADGVGPTAGRRVTASVGAVLVQDTESTPEELLTAADMTMYDAKDAGRDTFAVLDAVDGAQPRGPARVNWAARIREALRDDRFVLHAQPVVDLRTRETHGVEVLLRLVDEDGQLVMPGQFVHIAERMGLVTGLDRWVLDHGLTRAQQLELAGTPTRLSVNVSAVSLAEPGFVDWVCARIRGAAIDPARVTLELTETAAIANMEAARHFARRVHELGCRLALDDFGAGHGSFYYLKHLPFDVIKIDGEFVRGCPSSREDRMVIAAVASFAAGTGRSVVAEHVGDEATVKTLLALGVGLGQGDHLGVPAAWEDESTRLRVDL